MTISAANYSSTGEVPNLGGLDQTGPLSAKEDQEEEEEELCRPRPCHMRPIITAIICAAAILFLSGRALVGLLGDSLLLS